MILHLVKLTIDIKKGKSYRCPILKRRTHTILAIIERRIHTILAIIEASGITAVPHEPLGEKKVKSH